METYRAFNYTSLPYITGIQYLPDNTSKYVFLEQGLLLDKPELGIELLQIYILRASLMSLTSNNMIHITNAFKSLAENLIPLCIRITAYIDLYLRIIGVAVARYLFDVYDLGEEGYYEPRPFIEVYINVKDIDEMLKIWEGTVNHLRSTLGEDVLKYVDIFFTRAI
ncbi:MAG: hypothetical protein QXQ57_00670 [Sulfolobales archaeon]